MHRHSRAFRSDALRASATDHRQQLRVVPIAWQVRAFKLFPWFGVHDAYRA